jgi:uncharacterized membrane protein YkvA (DUF1232 family)
MSKSTSARGGQTIRNGWRLFRNRKTLWQMIREVLSGKYRMSFLTTVIVIVSLAYVVFPFDLIPDYIPIIGWIDDGLILYLMMKRLHVETQRYNRFKAMERRGR